MKRQRRRVAEGGFFLIEAMVALLIFALGILGLVAMGGTAVSSQSDAQYRTEASSLADAIAGQIALGVDRTNSGVNIPASLANFANDPGGANCAFNGGPTGDPAIAPLIARARGLPGGMTPGFQQIVIDAAGSFNRVQITLCWRTASDAVPRRHTVITYVN